MKTVNIGGDRLGSGAKMQTTMHGYDRSNHDLSYMWKSTMAPGTLVPFMSIPALPGDTFDIDLDALIKTAPTVGPLFGSFKLQLDVFSCPMRLYNKLLHNNALGIGMNIQNVLLPQLEITGQDINTALDTPINFQQINQSSLLAYLGIRGLGMKSEEETGNMTRRVNAIPYLAYWDIFKNYYANKQEEFAYVVTPNLPNVTNVTVNGLELPQVLAADSIIRCYGENLDIGNVEINLTGASPFAGWWRVGTIGLKANWPYENDNGELLTIRGIDQKWVGLTCTDFRTYEHANLSSVKPNLDQFPLKNIDDMRNSLLGADTEVPYIINSSSISPYSNILTAIMGDYIMGAVLGQSGLAVKTYQSDVFNNWIQTEWIEGANSIAELTKISTAGDSFTIDTLNLSKKVYDMLNRIAVSGGSYEDYIGAVYDVESKWRAETPIYYGGLSKEVVFQEVISNAATTEEPLGTLAGKGIMSNKHKGSHVVISIDEPSYLIGIVSLTPRICYSQGNQWDVNLKTLNDLHKPALDGIGYQDLITDQMNFADTIISGGGNGTNPILKSAGKQPAWINYMTNHDKSFGNFADERSQQFMTLDRRYSIDEDGISDLTTYIDPSKFNYAFAQTDLSAQNFWAQIAVNINARRKMSAKIIPNL